MVDRKSTRIGQMGDAAAVRFVFDGQPMRACQGESVAAALFASGVKTLRTSPRTGMPRGMFCLMGSCQECLVIVDDRRVLACRTTATDGMRVDKVPETGLDI
jgi:aerobic-type carbon monoxide dehydrogenase small subunit (CoxS/CutS family)